MRTDPENRVNSKEIWSELQKSYVQVKEITGGMYVCCCDGNVNCAGDSKRIRRTDRNRRRFNNPIQWLEEYVKRPEEIL